jgi:hypothetical protein
VIPALQARTEMRLLCGKHPDDVLKYSTARITHIHDWRLGALRFAFVFSIVCYVIIYRIFYMQSYIQSYTPIGQANFRLKSPTTLLDPGNFNSGCNALDSVPG